MKSLSAKIRSLFRDKRVVILGDVVADQFLNGTIARVSREAPVFILRHDDTETRAGAAANAAVNVASLGGKPVLVGLVGDDENGRLLMDRLRSEGVCTGSLVVDGTRRTTTKIRVLAGQHYAARQQVIRIDYEPSAAPSNDVLARLKAKLEAAAADANSIVISDYNYGVADEQLIATASRIAADRSLPLIVDSRSQLARFSGATDATPNQEEVEQLLGAGFSGAQCAELRERLGLRSLLVTCGNKGMLLFEKNKAMCSLEAVGPLEPVDVTGAGDTVIAAYALGLAASLTPMDAATVANHAGGIVVMKKGTASVSIDELESSLSTGTDDRSLESTA